MQNFHLLLIRYTIFIIISSKYLRDTNTLVTFYTQRGTQRENDFPDDEILETALQKL